jgi:predicted amidohydrolase YtcJ
VERTSAQGRAIATEQSVDAEAALRWWTSGATRSAFLEGERGSIAPGLRADLVLLDRDPVACPTQELQSTRVKQVWIGGAPMLEDSGT